MTDKIERARAAGRQQDVRRRKHAAGYRRIDMWVHESQIDRARTLIRELDEQRLGDAPKTTTR